MGDCLLHYVEDIGMLVCYFGGEFTAAHHDAIVTLANIRDQIDPKDYNEMERILTRGGPAESDFFSRENKMKLLQ